MLKDSSENLKMEKITGTLMILFYVSLSSPQRQDLSFFIRNTQTHTEKKTYAKRKTSNHKLNQ